MSCGKWERENQRQIQKHPWAERLPLGPLSMQQEARLNDVFLCQLVTEVTSFSKWAVRAAEKTGANSPTSESLTQAVQGMWREDSLLPKLKQVVQPMVGLVLSPGAGRRTDALTQLNHWVQSYSRNHLGKGDHAQIIPVSISIQQGGATWPEHASDPVQQLTMQLPASLRDLITS